MSIGIIVKGPEGLVLAAESRITLSVNQPQGGKFPINYDNASKLLSFSSPNLSIGTVTFGLAAIGQGEFRTAQSYVPEFEARLPPERLRVHDFAQRLSDFFMEQWQAVMPNPYQGAPMVFVIGGFDEGEAYGRVFEVIIPTSPAPAEKNPHPGPGAFGITWGGQREIVDRLITGYDPRLLGIAQNTLNLQPAQITQFQQALGQVSLPIPCETLALQDCVDLAIFFIRTTITAQRLAVTLRGCGGPIDVATITRRDGLQFIQRKQVYGEQPSVTERSF